MSNLRIHNVNVASQQVLVAPAALRDRVPVSDTIYDRVAESRQTIEAILDRSDDRLLVVVGPCSIHDIDAAMDYARRLKALAEQVDDTLYIIMRVYFEKPRTTVGWKGLINDPHLDDSFDIEAGLTIGRTLLRDILDLGLPTATEALDPITPQYLHDLISWTAIGARTTESQTHREMASGLSSAVGFKNGTDGGLDVAVNAMKSVLRSAPLFRHQQRGQSLGVQNPGQPLRSCRITRGVAADPTMTACKLPYANGPLKKPLCHAISWLTAATLTPTKSQNYNRWSLITLPIKS